MQRHRSSHPRTGRTEVTPCIRTNSDPMRPMSHGQIEPMDGRVPFGTGLASFALSLLRSLSQRRSSLAQGEQ